jgi:membrane protease YdiL (CAAX protease family)
MSFPGSTNVRVDLFGWVFILVVAVVLPGAAIRSARRAQGITAAPKATNQLRTVGVLIALALAALFVARRDGISLVAPTTWTPRLIVISVTVLLGVTALGEALLRVQSANARSELWKRQVIPTANSERALWMISVVLAGVTEEVIFRGVLFALLAAITGSVIAAAVTSAIAFALAHFRQGWKSMMFIAITALLYQWLVIYAGSLVPAMIVHAIYNLVRGVRATAGMGQKSESLVAGR